MLRKPATTAADLFLLYTALAQASCCCSCCKDTTLEPTDMTVHQVTLLISRDITSELDHSCLLSALRSTPSWQWAAQQSTVGPSVPNSMTRSIYAICNFLLDLPPRPARTTLCLIALRITKFSRLVYDSELVALPWIRPEELWSGDGHAVPRSPFLPTRDLLQHVLV